MQKINLYGWFSQGELNCLVDSTQNVLIMTNQGLKLPLAAHPHKAGECAKSNYLQQFTSPVVLAQIPAPTLKVDT